MLRPFFETLEERNEDEWEGLHVTRLGAVARAGAARRRGLAAHSTEAVTRALDSRGCAGVPAASAREFSSGLSGQPFARNSVGT